MEDFDKNNNKISLTSQCDKKYHKIKTHPETGIFLYKSIKWKTLEKSDYLRKKPGHVVDPDLFLVVALLEVSKYVFLCYCKVFSYYIYTAHTHTMETHSMEKVPSMENFSINQTE